MNDVRKNWFGRRRLVKDATFHLRKARSGLRTISYDFDGDGKHDSLTVRQSGRHVLSLTGSSQQTQFQLEGRSLLSGNFVDLNGDGALDEIDVRPLDGRRGRQNTLLTITLNALPFLAKERESVSAKYRIRGFVVFPGSFYDWEGDGDLDCVSIVCPSENSVRNLLRRLFGRGLKCEAHLYQMTIDGLDAMTPVLKKSIALDSTVLYEGIDRVKWSEIMTSEL